MLKHVSRNFASGKLSEALELVRGRRVTVCKAAEIAVVYHAYRNRITALLDELLNAPGQAVQLVEYHDIELLEAGIFY